VRAWGTFSGVRCAIFVGLYRTLRPLQKSRAFSKSGLSRNRTFSFPDIGLLKIEKKIQKLKCPVRLSLTWYKLKTEAKTDTLMSIRNWCARKESNWPKLKSTWGFTVLIYIMWNQAFIQHYYCSNCNQFGWTAAAAPVTAKSKWSNPAKFI
jgi:hypothetical protein